MTTTTINSQRRFSELLKQHQPIVFKVARTYCWHPDDRAELTQEIVTQLWRAFAKFDSKRKFSTWMYRIALNVAISFVRSNSLRQRHFIEFDENTHDIADHSSNDSEHDEQVGFLYRFINQLNALNRALLMLYLEERSYQEIADILGITETNVATKINRLKQRLRRATNDSANGKPTVNKRNQNNDQSSHHGTR